MSGRVVAIGNSKVGDGHPCYLVAEIGINHNGSLETTKKLIDGAVAAGCNAVKFQKRTIDVVYTPEELDKARESPFGSTNRELKRALEFSKDQYTEIDVYCKEKGVDWFVSCWDEGSVEFMEQFDPPCYKIASASLTDDNLLRFHRRFKRPIILSTGMSSLAEIDHAVDVLGKDDLIILHCTSTYPSKPEELNLRGMETLKGRYGVPTGYSGHEVGLYSTYAAAVLGACMVERHITLDRAMWGTDQAASLELPGLGRLCRDIRELDLIMGDGVKRVYESEIPIIKKLRRVSGSSC